jgi:hypothetical protein
VAVPLDSLIVTIVGCQDLVVISRFIEFTCERSNDQWIKKIKRRFMTLKKKKNTLVLVQVTFSQRSVILKLSPYEYSTATIVTSIDQKCCLVLIFNL